MSASARRVDARDESGEPVRSPRERPVKAVLTLYSKPDCHLCVQAREILLGLRSELGFELREVDITGDEELLRAYFELIPVGVIDGEQLFEYFVEETALRERLESIL